MAERGSTCWIEVDEPFSLAYTAQALRRIPQNVVDRWEDGVYARAVRNGAQTAVLAVSQTGGRLALSTCPSHAVDPASQVPLVHRLLGLDVDISLFDRALRAEPALRPIAERLRGLRPPRFAGLFETIGSVIPFQQVSLQAGMSMTARMVQAFGERVECEGRIAWLFPLPETIAEASPEALRDCALSGAKARTLVSLARLIADGELTEPQIERLPSEEGLRLLDSLPGIGPWTAGVILLRGFGRLDVFPVGDAGARRSLALILGRSSPLSEAEEGALLERLGPARGLLYFYTLGWHLAQRGLLEE